MALRNSQGQRKKYRALAEFAIEMEYEKKGKKRNEVALPDSEPQRKEYGVELYMRGAADGQKEVLASPDANLDTVVVTFEKGATGLYFATSRDLKGLVVAEDNLDVLYEAVPKAIADLYQAKGKDVTVAELKKD
jgi:hypothetical protein